MQSIIKLPNAGASQITVTATATTVESLVATAASAFFELPHEADALDIQVEANSVRYLVDGNTPTTTVGFLLEAGTVKQFRGADLHKLKLVRATGSDATVNLQFGKILR